jgi:hypothetical protein
MKYVKVLCIALVMLFFNVEVQGETLYTQPNSDGNGNVVYLDRHNVACGAMQVMTSFKLERVYTQPNHIRYKYRCVSGTDSMYPAPTSFTNWDNDGSSTYTQEAWYLDRQPVDCGMNGLINRFQLRRKHIQKDKGDKMWVETRMRYEYKCLKRALYENYMCTLGYTNWNDAGNGSNHFLDRHQPYCSGGKALSYFRLQRNSARTKYRYRFRCCTV